MNGDRLIPSSFRALVEECALRATEEDIEGVPEWERFRVVSHEVGLLLYILARSSRRLRIVELSGGGGAASSIAWLAGAASDVGGEVVGWEGNPRRLLKLRNCLSRARLAHRVQLGSTDPLFEEGGGVIAPPADEDGKELESVVREPRFDCVVVHLTEPDWPGRLELSWDLLEPDGLLFVVGTMIVGREDQMKLGRFLDSEGMPLVAVDTSEGLAISYKLASKSTGEAESADVALVGRKAASVLNELERRNAQAGSRLWAIPPETGRFLWLLARAMNARRILEIGASGGYSGIWLASALAQTDGHLTTMDRDPDKVALARANYEKAGVAEKITVLEGDALDLVPQQSGPFDLVFLDCGKEDYLPLLESIIRLLRHGGLLVADNAISHKEHLKSYTDTVQHHPDLASVTAAVGSGEEVTIVL